MKQPRGHRQGGLARAMVYAGILLPVLLADAGAQSASEPSDQRGLVLVQRLCVSCHLPPDGSSASAVVGIPSLRTIANRQGQSGPNIERVLINPHPPMPDIRLTNDEVADIITYLDTLRSDRATPLVPRSPAPIPELPRKS